MVRVSAILVLPFTYRKHLNHCPELRRRTRGASSQVFGRREQDRTTVFGLAFGGNRVSVPDRIWPADLGCTRSDLHSASPLCRSPL